MIIGKAQHFRALAPAHIFAEISEFHKLAVTHKSRKQAPRRAGHPTRQLTGECKVGSVGGKEYAQ